MKGDYETAPTGDGRWKVQQHGASRAVKIHDDQASAWDQTRSLARGAGAEALLKNRQGRVRERNTYGPDRFPPRG